MNSRIRSLAAAAPLLVLAACAAPLAQPGGASLASRYRIALDESRPDTAAVTLALPPGTKILQPARDGNGEQIGQVRCSDGRDLPRSGSGWLVPAGCAQVRWAVRVEAIDGAGMDASLPRAAMSLRHRFWVLPERAALLRAGPQAGTVEVSLRGPRGHIALRRLALPSNDQPPFYAVIGAAPTARYAHRPVTLRVFGPAPAYPWMDRLHGDVLAAWARWRRDLTVGPAPTQIDWAWVEPAADLEPGYNASAGAEAIVSQIKLREGDPDAEAKARAVIGTSAAHEGFHTITGAAGQAWPAWVNESLANHYAIEAARAFLPPADFRFVHAFYIAPDVRVPLLQAQSAYASGDGSQGQVFYTYGARFWREIERVLTNPPGPSGRLAALIQSSRNFAGVDLNDAADLARFLDRHSASRAGPIVRCFLRGEGCPPPPPG
jgi:hypothetical protein